MATGLTRREVADHILCSSCLWATQ